MRRVILAAEVSRRTSEQSSTIEGIGIKMKRIVAILLSMALCIGLPATLVNAAEFQDIPDQPTQTAVALLRNIGIVTGFPDGTFRPHEHFTRAQFCTMAVLLSGVTDVTANDGFTIFPDVRADHWARGYINTAVRALNVVTGFPDGTFKPDIPITYAQAVTALMRLLGYSDSDVGPNWPQSYLTKANQIGLTGGLTLGANDLIPRGTSALMFYNAIFTYSKSGARYCDELGFTEQRVIVLQRNGISPDGQANGLVTIGGGGFYPCRSDLPIDEGARGTLLVDADGYALSWTPDRQSSRDLTVSEIGPMSVSGTDNHRIDNIPSSALVYLNGEATIWQQCWIDIPAGLGLRFYFNAAGAIDYIIIFRPVGDAGAGDVCILGFEPTPGSNPLPSLGISSDAQVFKNGALASWSFLRRDDVLVYDANTNTVTATDFRITAIYENARPSREAPDEVITLGGRSFRVLPEIRSRLASSRIGDAYVFLFTPDGRVADVRTSTTPVHQPGIVVNDRSVELYDGTIISSDEAFVTNSASNPYRIGTPVMACMTKTGVLGLQTIQDKGSVDLDMIDMMAGTVAIAPYAVIMDLSGTGGRAVLIKPNRLPNLVESQRVLSVNRDSGGRANLIILRNVTGDAWVYGFTTIERGRYETIYDGPDVIHMSLPNLVHVADQGGQQTFEDPRSLGRNSGAGIFGVAVGTNGIVIASQACTRVNNVRRTDFSGNTAVTVSGVLLPLPEGLMVYVQSTEEYITVADARLYSNNFSVFLDAPAADGGMPRFIIAL